MKNLKVVIWFLGITLLLCLGRGFQWVIYTNGLPCSDATIKRAMSPDGSIVAVLKDRNCGATTDSVQFVCLRHSMFGTLFGDGDKVLNIENTEIQQIIWKDSKTLQVTLEPSEGKILYKQSLWGDITIIYKYGNPTK